MVRLVGWKKARGGYTAWKDRLHKFGKVLVKRDSQGRHHIYEYHNGVIGKKIAIKKPYSNYYGAPQREKDGEKLFRNIKVSSMVRSPRIKPLKVKLKLRRIRR